MSSPQAPPPCLWSLRPAGEHAALRGAARIAGWRLRALPVLRLRGLEAGESLRAALACPIRIATSPAAVRFARHQAGQWPLTGLDLGVGSGTAQALRAAGAPRIDHPERMDSEGLLEMPALATLAGIELGLLTAPGGRNLIEPLLVARGARVHRAEVYARCGLHPGARRLAAFVRDRHAPLLASSGEALARLCRLLPHRTPPDPRPLVVASNRLADQARAAGFTTIHIAPGPRPCDLLATLGQLKP